MINFQNGNEIDIAAVLALHHPRIVGTAEFAAKLPAMSRLIKNSNVVVSAWDGPKMVGVARALSDFGYVTFLVDLAVDSSYRRQGIGRELVSRCKSYNGKSTTVFLNAAEAATSFYNRIGFEHETRAMIHRRDQSL